MKKLTTLILIVVVCSIAANAQIDENVLIGLDGPAYGIKIKTNWPNHTGGWARGFAISNQNNTSDFIRFGATGSANNGISSMSYGFIGKRYNDVHMSFLPNGRVGIGTTTPSAKLDVNGNFYTSGIIKVGQACNIDNSSPGIVCMVNDDFSYNNEYLNHYGFGFHKFADPGQPADGRNAYMSGYFGINLFSGRKNRLRITHYGNVGIGTTSPSAKLDVAGNIKAHEIEVTLAAMHDLQLNGTLAANNITYTANGNTADFVFEDNYQLKDLSEVETFIKTNKHLPEIPSAEEMEEAGVNLAEMNKLLLMKVEELTLYSIQQEKRIEALSEKEADIERLKAEVSEVRSSESEVRREMEKEREERRAMRGEIKTQEERLAKMEALIEKLSNR